VKSWKNLYTPIIIILLFLGSFGIIILVNSLITKNHKSETIKHYGTKLKSCFDLENKNNRKIHESLELLEYCVKEFGID
tara:strand:- start:39 stop:275 length:237 start_codon:yes stop_codon:yes gene_type:complete